MPAHRAEGRASIWRVFALVVFAAIGFSLVVAIPAEARQARNAFPEFRSCITGRVAVARATACTTLSTPVETPLRLGTAALALSPDGNNLYGSGGGAWRVSNFSRDPGTGSLSFRDCVTGSLDGPPGPCSAIPTAQRYEGSGLSEPGALVVSPDGRSVYVLARQDRTVATFARDPLTGTLNFRQCLGGPNPDHPELPCTPLPGGGPHHSSLLTEPIDLVVSPDGRSVYASSYVGGVVEFQRDPATGDLRFQGCLTDAKTEEGCRPVRKPRRRPEIDYAENLIVSANGRYLYANRGAVILVFERDVQDGSLTYRSCINSAVRRRARLRIRGCAWFPNRHSVGSARFFYTSSLALNPDGGWLYAGSSRGALTVFRTAPGGRLKYRDCVTVNWRARRYCKLVPGARRDPKVNIGSSVAIAPDGRYVYTALGNSTLASFRRFRDGQVRFEGCVSGATRIAGKGFLHCKEPRGASPNGARSGLPYLGAPVVSPDGKWIYAGSYLDQSLVAFQR